MNRKESIRHNKSKNDDDAVKYRNLTVVRRASSCWPERTFRCCVCSSCPLEPSENGMQTASNPS